MLFQSRFNTVRKNTEKKKRSYEKRGKFGFFSPVFLFIPFPFRYHLFYIVRIFDTEQNRKKRWKMEKFHYSGEELFSRKKKGERGYGALGE
jgi:hypothetical protein